MTIRSRMSSIMDVIRPEVICPTYINKSVPNLVKINMTIGSQMSSITDLIGPELSELSVLELEKLPYLTLFTIQHLQI